MTEPVEDLLWRGRIQLGDEPGVYGDANYAGLAVNFPVELFGHNDSAGAGTSQIIVEAEEVKTYAGERGHEVVVFGYFKRDGSPKWERRSIGKARLKGGDGVAPMQTIVDLPAKPPKYISVQVQSDVERQPGLYDEMIVTRLLLRSTSHYGFLGFRYTAEP